MKYLDTSAFVKYYASEEFERGFSKIRELIDRAKAGNEKLMSNIFIIGETVSVFDKWVRLRLITPEELDGIIKRFLADIRDLVVFNPEVD